MNTDKNRVPRVMALGLGMLLACSAASTWAAPEADGKRVVKKVTTPAGNTVKVVKGKYVNEDGDVRAHRRFNVRNSDGEVILRGRDRGYNGAEGVRVRQHQRHRKTQG